MATLLDLPGELIELIGGYVAVIDFDSFISTCTKVQKCCFKRLLKHRHYQHKYSYAYIDEWVAPEDDEDESNSSYYRYALHLLSAVHQDPVAADYIRYMDVADGASVLQFGETEVATVRQMVKTGSIANDVARLQCLPANHKSYLLDAYTSNVNATSRDPTTYEDLGRQLLCLLAINLRYLSLGFLMPGSTLDRALLMARNSNHSPQIWQHLRSLRLTVLSPLPGNIFTDLDRVSCMRTLEEIELCVQQGILETQHRCRALLWPDEQSSIRPDVQLPLLKKLSLTCRTCGVAQLEDFVRLLPSLEELNITAQGRGRIPLLVHHVALATAATLKTLRLDSIYTSKKYNVWRINLDPFVSFMHLNRLCINASWILSRRESHRPPALIDCLPSSLTHLGVGLPSLQDMLIRSKLLFNGFAAGVADRLPALRVIRFSEPSRIVVDQLQTELEQVDSHVVVEVGSLDKPERW